MALPAGLTNTEFISAQAHGRKIGLFNKAYPMPWIENLKLGSMLYQVGKDDTKAKQEFLMSVYLGAAKLNLPDSYVIANETYTDPDKLIEDILNYIQDLPTKAEVNSKIALLNQGTLTTEKYLDLVRELRSLALQVETKAGATLGLTKTQMKSICEEKEKEIIKITITGLKGYYKTEFNAANYTSLESLYAAIKTTEAQHEHNRVMKLGHSIDKNKNFTPNKYSQRGGFGNYRGNYRGRGSFNNRNYQNQPQTNQNNSTNRMQSPQNQLQNQLQNQQQNQFQNQYRAHNFNNRGGAVQRPPIQCHKHCPLGRNVGLNNMNALSYNLPAIQDSGNQPTRATSTGMAHVARVDQNSSKYLYQ